MDELLKSSQITSQSSEIVNSNENGTDKGRTEEIPQSQNLSQEQDVNESSTKSESNKCTQSSEDRGRDEETPSSSLQYDTDGFAAHITYNDALEAIYTDPNTKSKYKWNEKENEWIILNEDEKSDTPVNTSEINQYYDWCSESQQWIPKSDAGTQSKANNYKWNPETKQWVQAEQSSTSEDGSCTYKDSDGTEFFWDVEKKAWFPKIDEDFLASYQMNYGLSASSQLQEIKPDTSEVSNSMKLEPENLNVRNNNRLTKKPKSDPQWFDIPDEQNTKVYVDNLPLDITLEEFIEVMTKCGLIMKDPKTQKYKVKLYTDATGQFKGDGLCNYIKVESVELALKLLNDYEIRGKKMKVQLAKFEMRGKYNPTLKPKLNKKEKEKMLKFKERLFDWRPEKMRGERSKHERVVIIKNLFSPEIFEKEVQLILEYQNDLRDECAKCGQVKRVIIYDRHPEGVAQITMSDPEEAESVIQIMNGRFYGKRKLCAEIWDGKTKYKVTESAIENSRRLENWSDFLTSGAQDNIDDQARKRKREDDEKDQQKPAIDAVI